MPPQPACFDFLLLQKDVSLIAQEAVAKRLQGKTYEHTKVNEWISQITTAIVSDLQKLSQHFKYIVTCWVSEKRGGGVDISCSAVWDEKSDGACCIKWENPAMTAFVFVGGAAL